MSTALTVRVDSDLKKQAEATVASMGLTLTSAVTVFLKTMVRQQRIPFDVRADGSTVDAYFNPTNRAILDRSIAAANQGEFAMTTTIDQLETAAA